MSPQRHGRQRSRSRRSRISQRSRCAVWSSAAIARASSSRTLVGVVRRRSPIGERRSAAAAAGSRAGRRLEPDVAGLHAELLAARIVSNACVERGEQLRVRAEVGGDLLVRRRAGRGCAPGHRRRCRRGGSGRSTASGPRRRSAGRAPGAARASRRRAPGRWSAAARARPGPGRCPGTRRSARPCSGGGSSRAPACSSRSRSRAQNSRSSKSGSPRLAALALVVVDEPLDVAGAGSSSASVRSPSCAASCASRYSCCSSFSSLLAARPSSPSTPRA